MARLKVVSDNGAVDAAVPLREMLQSLNSGVALVNRGDWSVAFENARFGEDTGETIDTRIPGFNAERAASRVERNRPYSMECDTKVGGRTIPVTIDVRPLSDDEDSPILVQCRDMSKQKEAEYMLSSYSEISEKGCCSISCRAPSTRRCAITAPRHRSDSSARRC